MDVHCHGAFAFAVSVALFFFGGMHGRQDER